MKKKIAVIDVGTTKICTIMGILDSTSGLRVSGVGIAPSHGIEKALVSDSGKARESIRESIRKAEVMAGYKLNSAYVGVTGRHVVSMNSRGAVAITRSDSMVRSEDLKRATDVALNVKIQPEHQVLHIIPRSYKIDGFEVKNPVGMNASELELDVHLITASAGSVQTLIQVIKGLGIRIEDLVVEPLASAEAVLTEAEKMAGVLLADMGGGTTDTVIIRNSSICHTSVLPAAGNQITTDISAGLGISFDLAEEMKIKYGVLTQPGVKPELERTVGESGQSISLQSLCEVMQIRVEEIIRLIVLDIPVEKYREYIPAGIVFTGGCANTAGLADLAGALTGLPVRIGVPATLNGVSVRELSNPAFATSVGMVLWSLHNQGTYNRRVNQRNGIQRFFDQVLQSFK
jgi:cell division protein FtsA